MNACKALKLLCNWLFCCQGKHFIYRFRIVRCCLSVWLTWLQDILVHTATKYFGPSSCKIFWSNHFKRGRVRAKGNTNEFLIKLDYLICLTNTKVKRKWVRITKLILYYSAFESFKTPGLVWIKQKFELMSIDCTWIRERKLEILIEAFYILLRFFLLMFLVPGTIIMASE